MSEPFLGEIRMAAFNYAMKGWATCDGQTLAIGQNSALFAVLGTTYGGNGTTTFALPDLRGHTPIHWGQGPGWSPPVGARGGEPTHTLMTSEIPTHSHPMWGAVSPAADQRVAAGNFLGVAGTPWYSASPTDTNLAQDAVTETGGGQAHDNMQPYLVVLFQIALQGIFPSRT